MMDHRRRFSAFVASGHDPRQAILEGLEFAREFLPKSSLGEHGCNKLAIIVEELVSNVVRHGSKERDLSLWLSLEDVGGAVELELEDDGDAFDPSTKLRFKGPDGKSGGGIGLAIVRAWGENITYIRNGERNVIRMTVS